MMFKRHKGRAPPEIQTVEGAISELLGIITQWSDPCGVVYSLKHKVEKQAKHFLVHVGKFDELDVAVVSDQIVNRKMEHSEYTVVSVAFDLNRRNIVIHVRKSPDSAN